MRIHYVIDICQVFLDSALVLKELDHRLVQSGKGLVPLELAGILQATAVKHISSTISAVVHRDTLLVRKGKDMHFQSHIPAQILELAHLGQFRQNLRQIRIFSKRFLNQLTQILDGERNALQEMRLLLKVPSESVCSQHLQCPEQHKQPQVPLKLLLRNHYVFLELLLVNGYQRLLQLV